MLYFFCGLVLIGGVLSLFIKEHLKRTKAKLEQEEKKKQRKEEDDLYFFGKK